jgi:hypothetical protein
LTHLFAIFFFPICRRFFIPIHAKRKFCVLKIPWRKKGFWQASPFFVVERLLYISIPELLVDFHSEHWFFLCNFFRVLGMTDWLTDY